MLMVSCMYGSVCVLPRRRMFLRGGGLRLRQNGGDEHKISTSRRAKCAAHLNMQTTFIDLSSCGVSEKGSRAPSLGYTTR